MNKKHRDAESKETNMIDEREREEDEEEEKKIETFFKLIKNYQEARKRRRQEFTENSGNARKKTNCGERSGAVVPAFQPEDFPQLRTDLKPLMTVSDHKKGNTTVKEEEQEEEAAADKGLDLNLALY